jgi:hypothetical protein
MPKKPKKPRKEPAERALIIDEWDKWVIGKIPKGEKGTDMQGLEFHGYLGREKPLLLEFKYAGNRASEGLVARSRKQPHRRSRLVATGPNQFSPRTTR